MIEVSTRNMNKRICKDKKEGNGLMDMNRRSKRQWNIEEEEKRTEKNEAENKMAQ